MHASLWRETGVLDSDLGMGKPAKSSTYSSSKHGSVAAYFSWILAEGMKQCS